MVVFFLFDPGQIRYRASVRALARVSFTYLHTTIYTPPPNEIPGYAPGSHHLRCVRHSRWSSNDEIIKISDLGLDIMHMQKHL